MRPLPVLLVLAVSLGPTTFAAPTEPVAPPLLKGLGAWHHAVSTRDPLAQRYFDQGLRLVYAFNHDEALRDFRYAAQRDPACAMCLWGVALALGPNINNPGGVPDGEGQAVAALQAARALPGVPAAERAYLDALAQRYMPPGSDRPALDRAYAKAMDALAQASPEDVDAQVLAAEAKMDLHPWRLWSADGTPGPDTEAIVRALERVLKAHPDHPGANHYYVHALEASPHPERALTEAARLPKLMPGAGHIVHMPAHIYMRTGQYDLAVKANEAAIQVDRAYLAQAHPQGMYATMYVAHNFQFLWAAASMEGNWKKASQAADALAARFPPEVMTMLLQMMPGMDYYVAPVSMVRVRFGKWDALLAMKDPGAQAPYLQAMWRYGRAVAFAAKGQPTPALAEQRAFNAFVDAIPADTELGPLNSARAIMAVARASLEGELALRRGELAQAISAFQRAVKAQDALGYDEPPPWFLSPRQELGFALLKAKRPAEAEAVYREDLQRFRENGWALFGLKQALAAQKKPLGDVARRFRKAWAHADVTLTGSIF